MIGNISHWNVIPFNQFVIYNRMIRLATAIFSNIK